MRQIPGLRAAILIFIDYMDIESVLVKQTRKMATKFPVFTIPSHKTGHKYLALAELWLTASPAEGHSVRQCPELKTSGIKYPEHGTEHR
jgi:hypothetical protein